MNRALYGRSKPLRFRAPILTSVWKVSVPRRPWVIHWATLTLGTLDNRLSHSSEVRAIGGGKCLSRMALS